MPRPLPTSTHIHTLEAVQCQWQPKYNTWRHQQKENCVECHHHNFNCFLLLLHHQLGNKKKNERNRVWPTQTTTTTTIPPVPATGVFKFFPPLLPASNHPHRYHIYFAAVLHLLRGSPGEIYLTFYSFAGIEWNETQTHTHIQPTSALLKGQYISITSASDIQ